MTDYARANSGGATHFTDKDGLSPGDANKVIVGAQFDAEFEAIVTAVASKYDSTDIASQAQAEGETSNAVIMTPLRVANWADANGGMVGDIHALADPGQDELLGWDDSAGAVVGFTAGDGLTITGTVIDMDILGIEDLTDPGGDRLMFWDNSAGFVRFLTAANALTISGTDLDVVDSSIDHDSLNNFVANEHVDHTAVTITAGSALSYSVGGTDISSSATIDVDLTGLVQVDSTDIVGSNEFLIRESGSNKALRWQDFGIPQTDDSTTTPFSAADLTYANRWYNCNNASAISAVIPANASVAYPVGTVFAFHQRGAGQVTVSVTSDTLRAPNGASTAQQYSTVFVTKVASTEWVLTGDSA